MVYLQKLVLMPVLALSFNILTGLKYLVKICQKIYLTAIKWVQIYKATFFCWVEREVSAWMNLSNGYIYNPQPLSLA